MFNDQSDIKDTKRRRNPGKINDKLINLSQKKKKKKILNLRK